MIQKIHFNEDDSVLGFVKCERQVPCLQVSILLFCVHVSDDCVCACVCISFIVCDQILSDFVWPKKNFTNDFNFVTLLYLFIFYLVCHTYQVSNDDVDDELLMRNGWPTKGGKLYFRLGPVSELLTITIHLHAMSQIWSCT